MRYLPIAVASTLAAGSLAAPALAHACGCRVHHVHRHVAYAHRARTRVIYETHEVVTATPPVYRPYPVYQPYPVYRPVRPYVAAYGPRIWTPRTWGPRFAYGPRFGYGPHWGRGWGRGEGFEHGWRRW